MSPALRNHYDPIHFMNRLAKGIQFLAMVVTGVGLIYGIVRNDERMEFTYLGIGIVIFLVGYLLDRKG